MQESRTWRPSLLQELRATWATASYNLRIVYRYPANIVFTIAMPLVFVLVGVVFSQMIDPKSLSTFTGGETNLPRYFAAGLIIWLISNSSNGLAGLIENEIAWGTLSSTFQSPVSRLSMISGFALSNLIYGGTASFLVLLPLVSLSGIASPMLAGLRFLLGMLIFFGMGMCLSAAAIRWRRVSGIVSALAFVNQFFCGLFIPVRLVPIQLRWISYILPETWVIDAVRSAFLGVQPLLSDGPETLVLAILAIVFGLLGYGLLTWADKLAGLHGLTESY